MKTIQKQTAVIIALVIAITLIAPIQALAADLAGREITSKGACVIDFDTGLILYGHQEDTPRVPASMTKLVTVYVVYDAIKAGEIGLDTVTTISRPVSDLSYNWEYSNVPLPFGATVTISQLIDVTIIWSACAATVALAEALVGSEDAFVRRMNEKMAALGIDAVFYDSYGVSANNKITPSGMAKLTRFLIQDHPEILDVASKRSVTFRGLVYNNTNQLLGAYTGADGLKTGYTDAAEFCFTGTAIRGSRRIIAVTMGSTQASRFADARILLDHGFAVASSVIAEYNRSRAAKPAASTLILDGEEMPINAYQIGSSHYFRLRDIAILLNGTGNQFDVTSDGAESTVRIMTGESYSSGGSVRDSISDEPQVCVSSPWRLLVDDVEQDVDAYLIQNSNYYKLRDLGRLLGFDIGWIQATRTVIIKTSPAIAA